MKGTAEMRMALALAIVLAATGCKRAPEPETETRPVWQGATIDGIAPLMSPVQVQAALDRAGYRQIPCTSDRPLLDDPLNSGIDAPCFRSPSRPMFVSLYFLDLVEGRRLAVVNFHSIFTDRPPEQEIAMGRSVAGWLGRRFGKPAVTQKQPDYEAFYWKRPGGNPQLSDSISTTVGRHFGANVTMTSMWAYGQERPSN